MCRICCQGIKIRKVGTQPLGDFRQRIWNEFEGFKKTGLGGQCSFNFIISANNMKKNILPFYLNVCFIISLMESFNSIHLM